MKTNWKQMVRTYTNNNNFYKWNLFLHKLNTVYATKPLFYNTYNNVKSKITQITYYSI